MAKKKTPKMPMMKKTHPENGGMMKKKMPMPMMNDKPKKRKRRK